MGGSHDEESAKANGAGNSAKQSEEINDLKSEIEAMRKQLSEIARDRK
jgi:hypothetical protein